MAKKSLLVFLALSLLLAGCSPLAFQNINDLLRAPALGQGHGEIQKALADTLNEEPQYKYPKEGELLSPLVIADLNGDGKDEGVLLYTLPGGGTATPEVSSTVSIAVLEQFEDGWAVTQDVKGRGTEVASLQVADLLGNGKMQLLVGYSNNNLSKKELAIYSYEDLKLTLVKESMPYSKYELGNFTGRGGTDLVVVSPLEQLERLQLYYIPTKDGAFSESQPAVLLEKNFTSCSGLYPSVGPDGKFIIVVDGVVSNGNQNMLASQLIYYPGEEDRFFTYADTDTLRGRTARTNMLLKSQDIDGDGIVEIPHKIDKSDASTPSANKKLEYVEWFDFTQTANNAGAEPIVKQFGLLDSDRAVYVRLPDEWLGNTKVADGNSKTEWKMLRSDTQEVLLSLRVLENNESIPVGALPVPGYPDTCLVYSNKLSAAIRSTIQITPLS